MSASNLSLKMLVLGLGLGLALSGCGIKGPLEPPQSASPTAKPATKADDGVGDIPSVAPKKTKPVQEIEAPKQPFIFDFLL